MTLIHHDTKIIRPEYAHDTPRPMVLRAISLKVHLSDSSCGRLLPFVGEAPLWGLAMMGPYYLYPCIHTHTYSEGVLMGGAGVQILETRIF